jgi:drug/metabolite transporter (DMT)-like permease
MQSDVFLAIIVAAALHALWNSLLKVKADPAVASTMLAIGGGLAATFALFFTGTPAAEAMPFLAASMVIHLFYWTLLGKTYGMGELGQIYPIARGLAPILTTLLGMALLGEAPKAAAWIGILTVVSGVLIVALFGARGPFALRPATLAFAAATALCVTGYSLVDGMGARLAGSAFAYTAFLYACNGWLMLVYGLAKQRRALIEAVDGNWYIGLLSGSLSLVCYGIGVWAMTRAPIGLVSALRETSILFAIAFGTLLLREPFRPGRLAGAFVVVAGLAAIRLA